MHWQNLTYFGDSMLLLPTALILAVLIYSKSKRWQSAFGWLVTFGIAGLTVSISKILFLGFFIGIAKLNFTGFSGHTTMSSTFWPVALWVISAGSPRLLRRALITLGYLLPMAIGYSRLVLHAHSPSEVISGLMLGLSLSTIYLITQRHTALTPIKLREYAIMLILPVVIIYQGKPATTQQFLAKLSAKIAGIDKAYTRHQLLKTLE